ncbi:mitochondrial glycine transporter-like [Rhopilema esculentum]|uniref:mitochondrial glycine transporter-like n=1 Tax=Rhopilema esculentum TaxID=499914 RepID=UPI0031E1567A|eukprot:gene9236-16921_t
MTRKDRSLVKSFLAGSFSGTCSCLLFQPLDLIKTRVQTPAVYGSNGMLSIISTVVRTDSITGLWRGVTPTISRTVPGVGIYFCALHAIKTLLFVSTEPKAWQNVLLGFTARSVAGVSLLPITVVKTRYESGIFDYRGVSSALVSIWKSEGVKGLFSGCAATVARDAPFSGLYLMFYNKAKELSRKGFGEKELNTNLHFMCGISAGVLASVATQPADVVKTQMQLYPFRYKSTIDCVIIVVKNNGPSGLFRGTLPRCIRRTLMAALTWTVYESVMQRLGLKV